MRRRRANVFARDEYCNTKLPSTDPLGGTKLGQRMEQFASYGAEGDIPVASQAGWRIADAGKNRVDVAVEFPPGALRQKWVKVNVMEEQAENAGEETALRSRTFEIR